MQAIIRYSPVMLVLIVLSACKPNYVEPDELTAYVLDEGNGVHKAVVINGVKVEVTYRPTDLWVSQEIGDTAPDLLEVSELRKKYDPYLYFVVSLSHDGREALHQVNRGVYGDLVQTMSFRMREYVTMTTNAQDTIPVGDFMLNRTYGMSTTTDLLFVFSREKVKDREWVQFNLNEFGLGVGNQRFRFRMEDLEGTPRIYKVG